MVETSAEPRVDSAAPLVSVLIPAHARAAKLATCLAALAEQNCPPESYEVIVCDDGTPIPLVEQLAPILPSLTGRMTVSIVRQRHAGPAAARNRAASHARGRFLAFTDDDCLPAPDWLSILIAHLRKDSEVLIGGGLKNAVADSACATATQLIMERAYHDQATRARRVRFFSTSNLAMDAEAFRKLGGFSEAFRMAAGEDYDLSARWQHHGGRTEYVPEAVVHHAHTLNFREFTRQHLNYGRGLFRVRQMMARRAGGSLQMSEKKFYLSLITHAYRHGGSRRLLHAGLVTWSQVATLLGAAYEAILVAGPVPNDPAPLASRERPFGRMSLFR